MSSRQPSHRIREANSPQHVQREGRTASPLHAVLLTPSCRSLEDDCLCKPRVPPDKSQGLLLQGVPGSPTAQAPQALRLAPAGVSGGSVGHLV